MYIDTHAHVHDRAFDDDRAEVVTRMREAGVQTAVSVGCDLDDSKRALDAARSFDLWCSVGIHPHEAKNAPSDIDSAFDPLLRDSHVRAVGEIGLDYYYDNSPRERQRAVFAAQLRTAKQRGLPVIFHHRDAFEDFVEILRARFTSDMRGVVHCFTGDAEQARVYTEDFGLLLGIGGVLTFKTAHTVRDAVRSVGVHHLVLETDCPYLAPVPHRGKRNEPSYVPAIAQFAARELSISTQELASVTTQNARKLFSI